MVRTEQVSFQYEYASESPKTVLRNLTLSVESGEFVAILGHNGSGKSTFAKLLNGLSLPTGGRVWVDGMDTADDSKEFDIRCTVGLVLQNPDNQLISTIVEEDVAFGPENLGVPPEEIRRRVDEALAAVGMTEYRHHAPDKLSGGQKQRIAIAGILAMQPKCLVLDEPTAMLDPQGRREVLEVLHRLNREQGMTVLLITHYMDEAADADRVIVIDDGEIKMNDVPRKVFSRVEELRAMHLDVPQPTELCYRLRQEGIAVSDGVLTVEECAAAILKALKD